MNMNLLKYHMGEHNDNQTKLSQAMHMSQSALSERMNGRIDFRKTEMEAIQKRYSLSAEELQAIFFAD